MAEDPRFTDIYLPPRIAGFPFVSTPRWSTQITAVSSGAENANQNWKHPLHRFTAPEGVRCWDDIGDLHEFWMALRGPKYTFALTDPLDSASRRMLAPGLAPDLFSTDQVLGVGDGVTTEFQLVKTYTYGPRTYTRTISHPQVDSVIIAGNALELDDLALPGHPYTFDVSRLTGKVTFDHAPTVGVVLTGGFRFDVESRWEGDDSYSGLVAAFRTAGFADLSFVEVPPC